jgi:hypothetical protein
MALAFPLLCELTDDDREVEAGSGGSGAANRVRFKITALGIDPEKVYSCHRRIQKTMRTIKKMVTCRRLAFRSSLAPKFWI